jgi:cytochrome c-type biogenesis protein CcmH/NrfG
MPMKKETAILAMVIALVVGFAAGAVSGILYMVNRRGAEHAHEERQPGPVAAPQGSPAGPPMMGAPPQPPGPSVSPAEVASKIQALKDILKKDPKNLGAWSELGNLYFDSDQPKEAVEAYNQYLAIKPDNADVRTDLGIMYRKIGDFDRALQEFRKAAQSDPKHVNSRYNIGIVLLHDKQDIKGAIQAWEEYLKVDTSSERALRLKGQIEKMKKMVK